MDDNHGSPAICPDDYPRQLSRLISRIERQRRRYMNSCFEGTGIQGSMFNALLTLDRWPGDSQDSLAEHMLLDKTVVARVARTLEKMGYISRRVDEDNRRQYKIYLTDAGRDILPKIRLVLSEWNRILTGALSDAERLTALELLSRMESQVFY